MKESLSVKDTKKLNQASALSYSNDPKKQDRARARRVEIDFKDFMRQKGAKKESFDIDPKKHRQVRRDAKIGNLARKTTNPGEKAAAEKKSKGPKLFGEEPERTSEYKAMQASLHPRGSSEGASAHRVYGWKKRPLEKDLKVITPNYIILFNNNTQKETNMIIFLFYKTDNLKENSMHL